MQMVMLKGKKGGNGRINLRPKGGGKEVFLERTVLGKKGKGRFTQNPQHRRRGRGVIKTKVIIRRSEKVTHPESRQATCA